MQLMTGKWIATGFEPIFKVVDVAQSVAWFEGAGSEVWFHDDPYAFAHRDRDLTIHVAQVVGDEPPGHRVLYIHCQEPDRVADEWETSGIEVNGLQDEDDGKREGSVTETDVDVVRSVVLFAGDLPRGAGAPAR